MIFPVKDWDKWYSAQEFGKKTSYGYHEGEDINLKTGGDTDLGQPLLAIADGEVSSVHTHTSIPSFGKHIHIKHDGPWGVIYCHYAHCQEINVKTGDKVVEGQIVATVGKTGTQYAHLHWAVKKTPTGIDAIAKTQEELTKWLNPIEFVLEWSRKTGGNMDWLIQYFNTNFQIDLTKPEGEVRGQLQSLVDAKNRYEQSETKVRKLEGELEGMAADAATWEERYQQTFRRAEELDAQIKEKNGVISDKDSQIFALTKGLAEVEGKVIITPEEYERLSSKECLKRFSRFQLLREFMRVRR
jgi:septal ring factor EnvC (AmiA/AmiB activator)